VNTVGTIDMSYVRREREATMGRSPENSFRALEKTGKRAPPERRGLDLYGTGIPNPKAGAGRLVNAFLRYHFNSVFGAYHSTNTAPLAVAIINLNPILITILCYG
jgi:hypothetical protein